MPAGALREGDVFGEMSCLRKGPASATVVARRAGTLLRLQSLEAILEGAAAWTDEGLVLV